MPDTRICAGIVTFNPDIQDLSRNIELLHQQVYAIFIVDNCSTDTSFLEHVQDGVTVIRNSSNRGLAAALNQLVRTAAEQGYHDMLLFDQDSTVTDGYVKALQRFTAPDVAIVCPQIVDKNKTDRAITRHTSPRRVLRPITSGGLYNIEAWKRVGGFRDDFFIELIDYEYDERCLQNGYQFLETDDAILLQQGGHAEQTHIPTGLSRTPSGKLTVKHLYRYNYSPKRYYYRYRNYMFLLHHTAPSRRGLDRRMMLKSMVHDVFFERHHASTTFAILQGMRDSRRLPSDTHQ